MADQKMETEVKETAMFSKTLHEKCVTTKTQFKIQGKYEMFPTPNIAFDVEIVRGRYL